MNPQSEPAPSMPYQVLIVDDHPLYRAALRGAVSAACAEGTFHEADSVASLFDTLDRHPGVDLLLLDLNLPGAHGFNALAYLRGSHPQLPVIVVSAMDDPATVHKAMAFGAQGFLSKSADAASIRECVQAVLRGDLVLPASYRSESSQAPDAGALEVAEHL